MAKKWIKVEWDDKQIALDCSKDVGYLDLYAMGEYVKVQARTVQIDVFTETGFKEVEDGDGSAND